jgi:hypothetical protein
MRSAGIKTSPVGLEQGVKPLLEGRNVSARPEPTLFRRAFRRGPPWIRLDSGYSRVLPMRTGPLYRHAIESFKRSILVAHTGKDQSLLERISRSRCDQFFRFLASPGTTKSVAIIGRVRSLCQNRRGCHNASQLRRTGPPIEANRNGRLELDVKARAERAEEGVIPFARGRK